MWNTLIKQIIAFFVLKEYFQGEKKYKKSD